MWRTHTYWFDIASATTLLMLGHIFFGHFSLHQSRWLRLLKALVGIALLLGTSAWFGRPWSWVLIGIIVVAILVVHGWWLPRHGVNGWTGEPRRRYYELLGLDSRGRKKSGVSASSATEIEDAEHRMRAAQLAADVSALDELIDDDLLFTGPNGQLGTKQADLDAHASGVVRFLEHEPVELKVRNLGDDVAVSALLARLRVRVAGKVDAGTYRYTRVWAREDGERWRVIGGHVSQVPET